MTLKKCCDKSLNVEILKYLRKSREINWSKFRYRTVSWSVHLIKNMAEKHCSKCENQLKVDDKYCVICGAAHTRTFRLKQLLSIYWEKRNNTKELPFSNLAKLIAAKTNYTRTIIEFLNLSRERNSASEIKRLAIDDKQASHYQNFCGLED